MSIHTPPPPEGYLADERGALIPIANISAARLLEDELVRKLVPIARDLNAQLAELRNTGLAEAIALRATVAQDYEVKLGGKKGNMTLRAFDGSAEIKVQIADHVTFGPQLAAAKELIDRCVIRWAEGAQPQLRALVDQAFQVNKEGRIDTGRVLGLKKLDMGDDAEWAAAIKAIDDAMQVTGSKTYIRFYVRNPKTDALDAIRLDLANA